ncbi:Ulp1 peptidase [Ranunculus cassubicifolius]
MADDKILSYNDVVLRRSDLDILSGPYFLNDRIIEFYLSYLSSTYPSTDILLVPPSISFWISNCPDPESLQDFILPLNFPDKKVIIFPVNDNEDVTLAEGGSHWSLLAYVRKKNVFVHHDSSGGLNRWHAKSLSKVVAKYLSSGGSSGSDDPTYIDFNETPQQRNGYDCGLYVTAIAKIICEWFVNGGLEDEGELWFSKLKREIKTAGTVSQMRNEILVLIRGLMVKK